MMSYLLLFRDATFAIDRLPSHPFGLVQRPGCFLEHFEAHGVGALVYGEGQGPCQPVFDEPDTANRTFIAILDMRQKIRLAGQRQVTLESEDNIPKGRIVSASLGAVSRKVDIDAPPTQLRAEVPEGQQLVCSNQDMNGIGEAGQGLDGVELV